MKRNRWIYAAFTMMIIAMGLGSRTYSSVLPDAVNPYLGDSLWAAMIYMGCGFLFRKMKTMMTGMISLFFCFFIEISQLYHSDWIDRIRDTSLGGLVLGYGFLWSDIEAYTIGIALCAAIELLVLGIKERRKM
ncbi:ribosomal maturation YjgA family protein [Bacillus sp. 0102A]|uniref:ribosomal maturation YjgA family protein n=1 Tax=Bacillus sp. 0102A TaxID=3120563 RepID=UPI002FD91F30